MKKIIVPNTNLECSKFIFGTSGLVRIFSKKERLKILNSAVDKDFSHFDTSPYYGFGASESILGEILKNNQELTITTKVGFYAPGGSDQNFIKMALRKSVGKIFPSVSKAIIDFKIDQANKSLEGSLKRLNRERIDLLLIHEPIIELIQTDEWLTWFNKLISAGKIRYYGLSSYLISRLEKCFSNKNKLFNILQTPDSIDLMESDFLKKYNLPFQITFGYMHSTKKRFPEKSYNNIFNEVMKRNPNGAIIIGTTREKHLSEISNLRETYK